MSNTSGIVSPSLIAATEDDDDDDDPPDADSVIGDEEEDDDDDEIGSVEAEMEVCTAASEEGSAAQLEDTNETNELNEELFHLIERSLQYQDLLLAKKAAVARLEHFKGFALQMSPHKKPVRVLANCEARVKRATTRINAYRSKYAAKRKQTLEKRAKAAEERGSLTEEQRNVNRVACIAIRKTNKYWRSVATRAALAAVADLGEEASEQEKMKVSIAAFKKAFANAVTTTPTTSESTTTTTTTTTVVAA